MNRLLEAAKAVVKRWDSPKWKDQPHTGEYINRLRTAIEAEGKAYVPMTDDDLIDLVNAVRADSGHLPTTEERCLAMFRAIRDETERRMRGEAEIKDGGSSVVLDA